VKHWSEQEKVLTIEERDLGDGKARKTPIENHYPFLGCSAHLSHAIGSIGRAKVSLIGKNFFQMRAMRKDCPTGTEVNGW